MRLEARGALRGAFPKMIECEFCGHEFPGELGCYGCPNCEGEPLPDQSDAAGAARRAALRTKNNSTAPTFPKVGALQREKKKMQQLIHALSAAEWASLIVVFCLLAVAVFAPLPKENA